MTCGVNFIPRDRWFQGELMESCSNTGIREGFYVANSLKTFIMACHRKWGQRFWALSKVSSGDLRDEIRKMMNLPLKKKPFIEKSSGNYTFMSNLPGKQQTTSALHILRFHLVKQRHPLLATFYRCFYLKLN